MTDLFCRRCGAKAQIEELLSGTRTACTGCRAVEVNGVGNAISKGFSSQCKALHPTTDADETQGNLDSEVCGKVEKWESENKGQGGGNAVQFLSVREDRRPERVLITTPASIGAQAPDPLQISQVPGRTRPVTHEELPLDAKQLRENGTGVESVCCVGTAETTPSGLSPTRRFKGGIEVHKGSYRTPPSISCSEDTVPPSETTSRGDLPGPWRASYSPPTRQPVSEDRKAAPGDISDRKEVITNGRIKDRQNGIGDTERNFVAGCGCGQHSDRNRAPARSDRSGANEKQRRPRARWNGGSDKRSNISSCPGTFRVQDQAHERASAACQHEQQDCPVTNRGPTIPANAWGKDAQAVVPFNLCACGCGRPVPVSRTCPFKYATVQCRNRVNHQNWREGHREHRNEYMREYMRSYRRRKNT